MVWLYTGTDGRGFWNLNWQTHLLKILNLSFLAEKKHYLNNTKIIKSVNLYSQLYTRTTWLVDLDYKKIL